jgi:hypothetical protein
MAAIERRTLKKAPPVDVVEAFTQPAALPAEEADPAPEQGQTTVPTASHRTGASEQEKDAEPAVMRRGPGRPRSKRRMEPFSSKLDIELRDSIDAYLFEHGGTLVDLLDEALRARIRK